MKTLIKFIIISTLSLIFFSQNSFSSEKIKIGLIVPISGKHLPRLRTLTDLQAAPPPVPLLAGAAPRASAVPTPVAGTCLAKPVGAPVVAAASLSLLAATW